jgi:hypothetical protein
MLETEDVQLSVLHFSTRNRRQHASSKVGRFIIANRKKFFYDRKSCTGESDEAWYAIVKTLLAVLIKGIAPEKPEEPLVEVR